MSTYQSKNKLIKKQGKKVAIHNVQVESADAT